MGIMKTPGVYIVEKNAFPNSVVEVATAVPAFIGYTEKAENKGNSLTNKPWRVTSMAEFHQYFGFGPTADFVRFSLDKVEGDVPLASAEAPLALRDGVPLTVNKTQYLLKQSRGFYLLYYSMLHFYQNGGGPCYVVSVDSYSAEDDIQIDKAKLEAGIKELEKELEPTMVVIPEAVLIKSSDDCYALQQAALKHCGQTMKNRMAILDIWGGYQESQGDDGCVATFRNKIGINDLMFGTAYYPWINTTIVQENDLSYVNVANPETLIACITDDLGGINMTPDQRQKQIAEVQKITPLTKQFESIKGEEKAERTAKDAGATAQLADATNAVTAFATALNTEATEAESAAQLKKTATDTAKTTKDTADAAAKNSKDPTILEAASAAATAFKQAKADSDAATAIAKAKREYAGKTLEQRKEANLSEIALLAKTLPRISPFFNSIMVEMRKRLNVLPPSPAMAGIYTRVDNSRGVWKAPANVSLNSVISPTVPVSSAQQEDLNVTAQGKSINAIRSFIGEGTLVWGARTLDGNSLDWRYVNVRRTMIMLEESIRLAAKAMVFEPNVANTWVTIKSMIRNFLTGIWKRGGLAGAVPDDAFSVHVGLGETMTPEDILEGILRVTVLVAISRPAEFIEITFQQQMQKS